MKRRENFITELGLPLKLQSFFTRDHLLEASTWKLEMVKLKNRFKFEKIQNPEFHDFPSIILACSTDILLFCLYDGLVVVLFIVRLIFTRKEMKDILRDLKEL